MEEILEHEFVENDSGELALVIDQLSEEAPADPVLLICPDRNAAYLHRGPAEIYEIADINPGVMSNLHAADSILVIEMRDEDIVHAYDTVSGFYEAGEEDDSDDTGVTGLDILS